MGRVRKPAAKVGKRQQGADVRAFTREEELVEYQ
jgi:hypothetical protein